MDQVNIVLPFLQFLVSLFLASLVMFSDPRDRLNRLFTLFLLAMALWGITIFGMRDAHPNISLAFEREQVALAVIPFSSIVFAHFVLVYTNTRRRIPILLTFYGLGVISAALSLTGQVSPGMTEKFYGYAPDFGWAFPIMLLASYPPVFLSLYLLTRAVRVTAGRVERQRIHLLRLGAAAVVLGGTSDLLPTLGINLYPMGIVGNLLFIILTTLAVTRYRLMNLRLVLRKGLAYSAVSAAIFAVYGVAFALVFIFADDLTLPGQVLMSIAILVIVGVFLQPLLGKVQGVVDRIFFRERFDQLLAHSKINELTKNITDFPAVASGIVDTVRRATQSDWTAIVLPDRGDHTLGTAADSRKNAPIIELSRDGGIVSWLTSEKAVLRLDEVNLYGAPPVVRDDELAALEKVGASILAPMISKGSLTGILVAGPKLVGSGYTSQDFDFLRSVADQAAVSVENASLYANAMREATERTVLAEIGRVVSSTLELETVFQRCSEQVRRLLPCDRFAITTIEDDTGTFHYAYVDGTEVSGWGTGKSELAKGSPLEEVISGQVGMVLTIGRPVGKGEMHPLWVASTEAGLRSMLAVPLLSNGRVIATMKLQSMQQEAYGPQQLELAERIGAQIANAIANSQLYEQALQLAEEREARAQLDAENRELQRVNEAKSAFLSTVSHELKTPLTSMLAFTDILRRNRQSNLDGKQLQQLEVIRRNGRRLTLLINDLLDLSRIESGSLSLEPTDFDARELVTELVESFEPIVGAKNQQIHAEVPDEPLLARADRDRITQVVSNLISNASKYSTDDKSIEIKLWGSDDRLYVRVRDHGIGISKADQKKLFTSFFRANNDETRSVPGTGLGLVIARGIVEMHGGEVCIDSQPGRGATVEFYIAGLLPEAASGKHVAALQNG
ncbi:MAG: ATP-binding protein [Dehalococcoidia bacterium]